MTDPLGLIGREGGIGPLQARPGGGTGGTGGTGGADFKKMLLDSLKEVGKQDRETKQEIEDFITSKRTDFEPLFKAAQKSDEATKMLLRLWDQFSTTID